MQNNTNATVHSELTGKSSNLSNSRDTTTTTCSACPSGSCLNFSSTEESERDYDLLSSSVSPVCNCDCECATQTAITTTSPTITTLNVCSSSVTGSACNASSDDTHHFTFSPYIANLKLHTSATSYNHRPSQLLRQENHHPAHYIYSSSLNCDASTSTCNLSSALSSANVCATGPATANSSYLCSTSAPLTGANDSLISSRHHSISKLLNTTHNNNTCSINNNSTSTTTTTLCSFNDKTSTSSPPPPPPPSSAAHHSGSSSMRSGFTGFFFSNNSRSTSKTDVNETSMSPHRSIQKQQHQQQQLHNPTTTNQHHQQHHNQHHHQHHNCDNSQHSKPLKDSDSLSDVSDTFEWWFQRHKRNSTKKSRYIHAKTITKLLV